MTAGNRNLMERVLVELVLQGKRMALSPSKMPGENGMHLETDTNKQNSLKDGQQ